MAKAQVVSDTGTRCSSTSAAGQPPHSVGSAVAAAAGGNSLTAHILAHNVANQFRDAGSKFTGASTEVWSVHVAEYESIARDYCMTSDQRYMDLHNVLAGVAKMYYLKSVQRHTTNFAVAVAMIENENNAPVKPMQINSQRATHHIRSLVAARQNLEVALATTYRLILMMAPQVPANHSGDSHNV